MGRRSNIILLNSEGVIVDSIRHVDETMSRVREVLPTLRYEYPPSQGKINAHDLSFEDIVSMLQGAEGEPAKRICSLFQGISPATAAEFATACRCTSCSSECLSSLAACIFAHMPGRYSGPYYIIGENGSYNDFSFIPPCDNKMCAETQTLCEALDKAYKRRETAERVAQRANAMCQSLNTQLQREERKAEKQKAELCEAENLDEYRLKAELLTANIYSLKKGDTMLEADNYYAEAGSKVTIELDPRKTPSQNAQSYYKQYNKRKATLEKLTQHYESTLTQVDYLTTQLYMINTCPGESELEEIREELVKAGYVKPVKTGIKKVLAPSKPMHFVNKEGFDLYVGRNNTQNDFLTLRFARGDDIWFHTKNVPGSHVIIKCEGKTATDKVIYEAAMLAAWFSKASSSTNVAVDYTQKRNIKKPSGSVPGYVTYSTNKTLYVTPDVAFVSSLSQD